MKKQNGVALSAGLLMISGMVEAQSPSLDDVFNGDMLNTNLRYFESAAGIARESWGDRHVYRIVGCRLPDDVRQRL
ncbi:hypothetical protein [Kushneria aurantia]|uniref:Uncharacterized protein n=1 Tax=Kushneria aurantia TaxID=504092 RepID=A0ABV6FZZ7_9GAMM|nr:hypothetical protein [Kushneria aurantia]